MKRHKSWRLIALVLTTIILILIYAGLVKNSEEHLREKYTSNYSYTLAEMISKTGSLPGLDQETGLTRLLAGVRTKYTDIEAIALVKGRRFVVHSDSTLTGERISKEIFDAQRELEKNYSVESGIEPFVIWSQDEQVKETYHLYYPVADQEGYGGTVYIRVNKLSFYEVDFSLLMVILILIVLLAVILAVDRLLPKLSFIFAVVLFVLTILLINSLLAGQMEANLEEWQEVNRRNIAELTEQLQVEGYFQELVQYEFQLPIRNSIKTWNYTLSFLGVLLLLFILTGVMEKFIQILIDNRLAYAYILPAMFGVFLLVFFPFIYGILIGFTDYNLTNFGGDLIEYFSDLGNYGFNNFYNILRVINFKDYSNFYFTLAHTVIWTITNLFFHVSIGVALALLLNDARLKGRTAFRILLILPWAIPNYITALIWKGMFHKQFGAVNGLLELLGFESISWFTQPFTSFMTNLTTNVWLGFPFMMIIALGALQSIPKELYEASAIDGSTKWQSFWNVTVPLLRPAMVPAIILGTIWTFNQFNVIYLVSGGGPDGATELLITDAYKLAFAQYRYGYAAAYCIIIFMVLLSYGIFTSKITRATKGAYE